MQVYISIGSNIEPKKHIIHAVNSLRHYYGLMKLSSVYESKAVGFTGANFYNLVAGFTTTQTLEEINQTLEQIEYANGRNAHAPRFTSRTLDLDLLLYGNAIINTPEIQIPRSDILQYAFVLKPLAELAGAELHPLLQQTYAQLWQQFDQSGQLLVKVAMDFNGL